MSFLSIIVHSSAGTFVVALSWLAVDATSDTDSLSAFALSSNFLPSPGNFLVLFSSIHVSSLDSFLSSGF